MNKTNLIGRFAAAFAALTFVLTACSVPGITQVSPAPTADALAPTAESVPTALPAPTATAVPFVLPCNATSPDVSEPIQVRDLWQSVCFPVKAKYRVANSYYCAAVEFGSSMPTGYTSIEQWPVTQGDGNFLSAKGDFSMAAFCSGDSPQKHDPKAPKEWTTGLVKNGLFTATTFPMTDTVPTTK